MLLDLAGLRAANQQVPPAWVSFVEAQPDGFVLRGDPTSASELFLFTDETTAAAASSLEELLGFLSAAGIRPQLSGFGISSLLHHGVVPLPRCEYEQVHFLTVGDLARVSWRSGAPTVETQIEFPWLREFSRADSVPGEAKLLALLVDSTERALASAGGDGFLMMSSGKDSTAIALALAELGFRHIPCVTYSSGDDDPEPAIAAEICRRLGLQHVSVEMPRDPGRVGESLTTFFESSARPGVDLAQIPYVIAAMGAGSGSGTILDGGGNDLYMGQPLKGGYATKMNWRIRGRRLRKLVQRFSPVDSVLNYAAKTRVEAALAGRNLRLHETRKFMAEAVDTRTFWDDLNAETAHLGRFDLMSYMERHMGPGASQKKHILAARAIGHSPSVPWCDPDLADYFFNLPAEHKYDERRGVNKVLLRRMLLEYLGYDAAKVGKRYFAFDGAGFVVNNKDFVRSEILSCSLWDRPGLQRVIEWIDEIERRPLLYHAILNVFMVSGWHNHSKYTAPVDSERIGIAGA